MVEMHVIIDELHRNNQTLEDDVHNIRERQLDSTHSEEMKLSDPQPLSDEIHGCLFSRTSDLPLWLSLLYAMILTSMLPTSTNKRSSLERLTPRSANGYLPLSTMLLLMYMGLHRASINKYQELVKKLVH